VNEYDAVPDRIGRWLRISLRLQYSRLCSQKSQEKFFIRTLVLFTPSSIVAQM
jgi:hypothetical protein